MNLLSKRKEHLEEIISKDLNLWKEYEDKLRVESDPQQKAKINNLIDEIKERVKSREAEHADISQRAQQSEFASLAPRESQLLEFVTSAISYDASISVASPRSPSRPVKLPLETFAADFNPPSPLSDFVGRKEFFDRITALPSETRFVVLTGILGIGKSSLLKQIAADSEKNKIFWYEFVPGLVSLDDLLVKLVRFLAANSEAEFAHAGFSTRAYSERDRIEFLIDELNRGDYRLFFDDFEAAAGDEQVKSFFRLLKKRLQKGVVFLASQDKPQIFTLEDEVNKRACVFCVEGLSEDETALYFERKNIRISAEALEKLDGILAGMPLALSLLVNSVGNDADEIELFARAETVKERVVEELFEALYQKLGAVERELLTTAALLTLPFSKQNLLAAHRAIFEKNAASAFVALARQNLVLGFSSRYYRTHKIIDELALNLTETDLTAARETVAEYFLENLPDDYIAQLQTFLLFAAAKNYDRAAGVASDLIDRRFLVYEPETAETVLRKLEDKEISRENRMWLLGDQGLVAHHLRRYDESAAFYEKMLALAHELEDKRGEALALQRLGALSAQTEDYDCAEDYYRRSLELKIELEDFEGQAELRGNLGLIYGSRKDFAAALAEFEKGIELRRQAGSPEWSFLALYSNLGILYAREDDWDKAFEFSEKALKTSEELQSPYDAAKSLYNLGIHESKRGDEEKAREKFLRVLETAETYAIDELEELSCTALGRSCGDAGEYAAAISYFERVAQIYERYDDKPALVRITFDIGTYHFLNDDYQASLRYYTEGVELFEYLDEKLVKSYLNNLCFLAEKFRDGAETARLINALKLLRRRLARKNPAPKLAHVCDALGAIYLDVLRRERAAIAYLRGSLKVFESLDSKRECATTWLDLGLTYEELERYKYALDANENALNIIESEDFSDLLGVAFYNTGNTYVKMEFYHQAENFYRRVEAEAVKREDDALLRKTLHNLGESYSRDGRTAQAVEILKTALILARERKDALETIFSLNSLGLAYEDLENETEALACWHEAVELSRANAFGREEANTLISIGNFYLRLGKFDSAKSYFERSFKAAAQAENIEMEEAAMLSLAVAHRRLGTSSEIEKDFTRIAECASELKHYEHLVKFLAVAGAVNLDEGETESSVEMFEQAFVLAYYRILEFAEPFVAAGERFPLNLLELPFVLTQFESSLERAVETGNVETARAMYRDLLEKLNRREIWREENFIQGLLDEISGVLDKDENDKI